MSDYSLRVALVFEYPTLNGGENSMLAVLPRLIESQVVDPVALAEPTGPLAERLGELNIPVVPFLLRDGVGVKVPRDVAVERLVMAVRQSGCQLAHSNSLSMGRLLGATTDCLPIPTTSHLRDILKLSQAAIRDLNRNRRLIAVSNATRDFHVEQGVNADRCEVIHNGIETAAFAPDAGRRQRVRQELGIPASAIVILTAGQIGLRKGLDTVAAAALSVSREWSGRVELDHPEVHWLLAGERFSNKQESIDFEAAVDGQFRSAEPGIRFHSLGFRHDLRDVMNASDILVHGARQEPLGRVLLEAAAAGLAIVATRVGGTEEILESGRSAILIAADSSEEISEAVSRLIRDRDERLNFGVHATRRIAAHFGLEESSRRTIRVWREAFSECLT